MQNPRRAKVRRTLERRLDVLAVTLTLLGNSAVVDRTIRVDLEGERVAGGGLREVERPSEDERTRSAT